MAYTSIIEIEIIENNCQDEREEVLEEVEMSYEEYYSHPIISKLIPENNNGQADYNEYSSVVEIRVEGERKAEAVASEHSDYTSVVLLNIPNVEDGFPCNEDDSIKGVWRFDKVNETVERNVVCDREDMIVGSDSEMAVPGNLNHVSKRHRYCIVQNCSSKNESLYTFPRVMAGCSITDKNLERCKEWVKYCGKKELLEVPVHKLYRKYFVCGNHFRDEHFNCSNRRRLMINATPTENLPSSLDESEMKLYGDMIIPQSVYCDESTQNSSRSSCLDGYQLKFLNEMSSLQWRSCGNCKETYFSKQNLHCLHGKFCVDYSEANDMDPGIVPDELKGLSLVEEQLIARINPIVSVYKVKGHQYCYGGNVISFPQKVEELAKKLPHKIENLNSIITIRTKFNVNHVDFHVHSGKVRSALIWLKKNNIYYHDVEICEESLAVLPVDGNVFNDIVNMTIASEDDIIEEIADEEGTLIESCIPMVSLPSEKEQITNVIEWPTIEKNPIDEFKTIGYIAQAFPCLYPTGKADLRAPRERSISVTAYFKHMMRFHDFRFARHPRFRFFALNSMMRWTAINDGNLYVSKDEEMKQFNVKELKQKLQQNPNFLKKVMFYCSNLKGTKPYWKARSVELVNMIEQLGMPTFFLTLSAADLHWPDLFKILCPNKTLSDISERERWKIVQENPMIVDKFFAERIESFVKNVLIPKYNIKDYWYRLEYQHRGSPHVHGVFWLYDAPDVTNLKTASREQILEIIEYFDKLITTIHPDLSALPSIVHPCRKDLREVINFEQDLAELLNKVQRHTVCSDGYCLRTNKDTQKKECRFGFPKELCDKSQLVIDNDNIEFVTKRNDPLLNKFHAYILRTWRANMDISPVLSKRALINYLAKYLSKPEYKSVHLQKILNDIFQRTNEDKHAKSIVQKLFIQVCSERDYSAQEVCHLLMGEKLFSAGGRQFVTVNFKFENNWILINKDPSKKRGQSIIEKYMHRSRALENVSLWDTVQQFDLPSETKKRKPTIVVVFPNIQYLKIQNEEEYCKVQVLLHVPWRSRDDFESDRMSWKSIFAIHEERIKSNTLRFSFDDIETEEEDVNEDDNDSGNEGKEDWMIISNMGPSMSTEPLELGRRQIDLNYDWSNAVEKYKYLGDVHFLKNFIHSSKEENKTCLGDVNKINVTFTREQRSVIALLESQIECVKKKNMEHVPKRVIVQGEAGTGKSTLIYSLRQMIEIEFGPNSCMILTPTGVAAANVDGATIQSKVQIPRKMSEFGPLRGTAAKALISRFQSTVFLFIDEFSMVGCNLFGMLEQRCRQGKENYEEEFGGLFVYLFGDVNQLPPVQDPPLYKISVPSNLIGIHGWLIFQSFEASVVLTEVKRQSDRDLKDILKHISEGKFSSEDYKILQKRFRYNISVQERDSFSNAVQIFATVDKVNETNLNSLAKLKDVGSNNPVPVAVICAKHNCMEAKKGSLAEASGLVSTLYLARGAKIMCKANLWTERGLVNGAIGTVIDIIYSSKCGPPEDFPEVIICRFDNFKGPFLNDDSDLKLIPIYAITSAWTSVSGEKCSRTQFPLRLAYACSIHQSQGLTLSKAIIDLGTKEIGVGLSYVALSRVRDLQGLYLEPFPLSRIDRLNKSKSLNDKLKGLERIYSKQLKLFDSEVV